MMRNTSEVYETLKFLKIVTLEKLWQLVAPTKLEKSMRVSKGGPFHLEKWKLKANIKIYQS